MAFEILIEAGVSLQRRSHRIADLQCLFKELKLSLVEILADFFIFEEKLAFLAIASD